MPHPDVQPKDSCRMLPAGGVFSGFVRVFKNSKGEEEA